MQDESVEGLEPKYPTGPKGSVKEPGPKGRVGRPQGERDLIVTSSNPIKYYCVSGCCAFGQIECAALGYGDGGVGLGNGNNGKSAGKGINIKWVYTTTDVLVKNTPVENKNLYTDQCWEPNVQCEGSTTCKKCCNGYRFVWSYFASFCW